MVLGNLKIYKNYVLAPWDRWTECTNERDVGKLIFLQVLIKRVEKYRSQDRASGNISFDVQPSKLKLCIFFTE